MIRPKSLQQRLALFMLLPVAILMLAMGVAGFVYARNILLSQWREAAILKLQRAAHHVDMRLSLPKQWLKMFDETAQNSDAVNLQETMLDQLQELEGVARVNLTWVGERPAHVSESNTQESPDSKPQPMGMGRRWGMMRFHRARIAQVTPPRYDALVDHETVSLISDLNDANGHTVGRLEVALRFDYLIENITSSGWWQSSKAFLVDDAGKILTCTVAGKRGEFCDNSNSLELETFEAMQRKPFGTVYGPGHPPVEISGFYRLTEAPWSLVVIAPGREILAPIVRFRWYYFMTGAASILFILALIRWVTGRTVSAIKDVSRAAGQVARGHYGTLLPVKTRDEVGELIESFNTMVLQLEERIRLKEALDLAMEVQQNLLPLHARQFEGLDIAGISIYCDETGGDYFDFLDFPQLGQGRIGIAVGDVVGHGLAAALMMTTVRALLRARMTQPGSPCQMISDVNRLLCLDTVHTGNFMTLFFMIIDVVNQEIQWVRAGHEPAIVYETAADAFSDLRGEGIVLGADDGFVFKQRNQICWNGKQILLIGTDGIWETQNPQGEAFGKDRLREIMRNCKDRPSQEICRVVTDTVAAFRKTAVQADDITLVVVKAQP